MVAGVARPRGVDRGGEPMTLGSIRHEIRIARPADDVWALVGDPARLHEWFPGIVACDGRRHDRG